MITSITFLIDFEKKRQLKRLLIERNQNITDFLIEYIDKEIQKYGKDSKS